MQPIHPVVNSPAMDCRLAGAITLALACYCTAPGKPCLGGYPFDQDKAALGEGDDAAHLRSTTRLVQVSVVVQDKHGNPILGLTKDDFSLFDEKQAQAIQVFSVDTDAVPENQRPPLPPDTYTNRLAERTAMPQSVTVILLDALNTEFSDQEYSRRQIIKFLSHLQPEDRIGIYTLDYRLNVLHDFTSDSRDLVAAVASYKGEQLPDEAASVPHKLDSPPERLSSSDDALQQFLSLNVQRESNFYATKRVRVTTDALQAIARHLGSLPGRKNLVWISGSFPITIGYEDEKLNPTQFSDQVDFFKDVERAIRALNEANVAVYPVDARGLTPADSKIESRPGSVRSTQRATLSMTPDRSNRLATMSVMAERTGGRIFYENNDLFEAVRLAVNDSRVTYELGYYPEGVKWDGKFHSIRVKVNSPGARVRARTGYFARPDHAVTQEERDAYVVAAAYSPIEATAIKMIVQVRPVDGSGARQMNVHLQFDSHDISFRQVENNWEGSVGIVYAQTDETGKVLVAPGASVEMKFTPERYAKLLKTGISHTRDVPIHREAVELRVILHDTTTGMVGSVIIPLKGYFPPKN